jgi:hypothetical protein
LRGQCFASQRLIAALQRTLGAFFVFAGLLVGQVALALLRADLGFDLDQRIFGFPDAAVEFTDNLPRVARRILDRIGR